MITETIYDKGTFYHEKYNGYVDFFPTDLISIRKTDKLKHERINNDNNK